MAADDANAIDMMVMKPRHQVGLLKSTANNDPAKVQKRQTNRFIPENAAPKRSASCMGDKPAAYPEEAASAIAQTFGLIH